MSNNSYVTIDGKEIGRAQGIQAEAAKIKATVWMNPILLKPRSDQQSEVVLFGKAAETFSGRGYRDLFYEKGLKAIQTAIHHLSQQFDVVVMEGAGSPVEINLKEKELVNMKVAQMADIPVILVADIDRGGVFASIVGTLALLTEEERTRVKGIVINKFRGDLSLFKDGVQWLEEKTGIPVLGVVPHIDNHMIDGEDSLSMPASSGKMERGLLDIVILKPPYISNYSDIEPFYCEDDVSIRWVSRLDEIGHPDAVILPGTKSTIRDLQFFKNAGFNDWLNTFGSRGGHIVGICGGYQMLGKLLIDDKGSDTGVAGLKEIGLGLIPATTTFLKEKVTVRAEGTLHPRTGIQQQISGYEIHLGKTKLDEEEENRFLLLNNGTEEGYYGKDGKIIGTYLHHLFHNDEWRNKWLNGLRQAKGLPLKGTVHISELKDQKYDELAAHLVEHLNWEKLKEIIFSWRTKNEMD